MKNIKVFFIIALVLGLIGGAVGLYLYNKPAKNVAEATPDKTFTADDLYKDIKTKDSTSLLSYKEKIVQVSGKIKNIESPNDTIINIFFTVSSPDDDIRCAMDSKYFDRLKNLKAGDELTVKGVYGGLNKFEDKDLGISTLDVDLARCVAIRK